MAYDNMGIKFSVMLSGVSSGLRKVQSSMSSATKTVNSGLGGWYNNTRKVNQQVVNLNKDLNRTNTNMGKLTGGLGSFGGGLKGLIGSAVVYKLGAYFAHATATAMDMVETQNLFNVSLRSTSIETGNVIDKMGELYGLDPTNLRNSVGTYSLLARSMGMSATQAQTLGLNTTKLAVDFSSLMNIPIQQVMSDLRSGLVGQSETVYKYGIDVTEAGIKAEALAQGISKSVRNMSQGEKMALRYSVMIKNGALAQGDFAKTIESPSNQSKIFGERITTLGRSIGSIFIPALSIVLPYLNAFVRVLTESADAVARLFGYIAPEDTNLADGIGGISQEAESATDSINGMSDAIKNSLLGIDQINKLSASDTSASGAGGVGGDSILSGMDLKSYDNMMDQIKSKTNDLFNDMKDTITKFFNSKEVQRLITSFVIVKDAIVKLREKVVIFIKDVGTWFDTFFKSGGADGVSNLSLSLANVADTLGNLLDRYNDLVKWMDEKGIDLGLSAEDLGKKFESFSKAIYWLTLSWDDFTKGDFKGWGKDMQSAIKSLFPDIDTLIDKNTTLHDKFEAYNNISFNVLEIAMKNLLFWGTIMTESFKSVADGVLLLISAIQKLSKNDLKGALTDLKASGLAFTLASPVAQYWKASQDNPIVTFEAPTFNYYSDPKKFAMGDFKMAGYASGGMPDMGQMFIAREAGAELVGNVNGKTSVMNNDQIVEAVSEGVARAVSSVMSKSNQQTNLVVNVGGNKLYEEVINSANRANTRAGKTVVAVGR